MTSCDHRLQGVQLDASSAGALHESLQALKHHEDADLIEIMQLLVTKPMQVRPCPWRAQHRHCSADCSRLFSFLQQACLVCCSCF